MINYTNYLLTTLVSPATKLFGQGTNNAFLIISEILGAGGAGSVPSWLDTMFEQFHRNDAKSLGEMLHNSLRLVAEKRFSSLFPPL